MSIRQFWELVEAAERDGWERWQRRGRKPTRWAEIEAAHDTAVLAADLLTEPHRENARAAIEAAYVAIAAFCADPEAADATHEPVVGVLFGRYRLPPPPEPPNRRRAVADALRDLRPYCEHGDARKLPIKVDADVLTVTFRGEPIRFGARAGGDNAMFSLLEKLIEQNGDPIADRDGAVRELRSFLRRQGAIGEELAARIHNTRGLGYYIDLDTAAAVAERIANA